VARLSNFTRAAALLHISQPALTKQIRQVEQVLGVQLFDRNTRSVSLTRIGKDLAPAMSRILAELDGLVFNTRELAAKNRGTIRIAALPSLCAALLPRAIARFRDEHPGVLVAIRDAVAESVTRMVKAEEVDFGIGSAPGGALDVRFSVLLSDRMVVAFPAGHPLEKNRTVPLKQLVHLPLVLMGAESSVRKLVDGAFASLGHIVAPAYEATYMSTAAGMVKAGLGLAIFPSSAIPIGELNNLATRPISQPSIKRELGVLEISGRSLSPAAEAFLGVVKASL
jgi:DNA-binding transcriptional LysR family regulator